MVGQALAGTNYLKVSLGKLSLRLHNSGERDGLSKHR